MTAATKTHRTLSVSDFVTILMAHEINGKTSAEFTKIVTVTEPDLTKKHRETKLPLPFKKIYKESQSFCMFKVIYENSVNKALVKEGVQEEGENLFVAEALPWGSWVKYANGTYSKMLIEHKGALYVRATFNLDIRPVTEYRDENGTVVPVESLEGYLPLKKDELVSVRSFKASSMREVHLAGTVYTIVPDAE